MLGRHTKIKRSTPPVVSRYVSVQRAAQILDCSDATVRRWVEAGVLVGRRFGRTIRIEAACLETARY